MKRLISFTVILLVIFAVLCGCGNSDVGISKEAVKIELSGLLNEMSSNTARAEEIYNGKVVRIDNYEAEFIETYNDYAVMRMTYWSGKDSAVTIYANVAKKEAENINKGDTISVVGVLNITSPYTVDLEDTHILKE